MTLTFQYGARQARLSALAIDAGPETYDLCSDHAQRTRPPHGWTLVDDRPSEAPGEQPGADDLRSSRTVAVLAAALRGDPRDADDEVVAAEPPGPAEPAPAPGPDPATDEVAAQVDVDALDAIVDQGFDDPGADRDLLGTPDEADPRPSADALTELRALSEDAPREEADVPTAPARTVPGARRPD